MMNVQTYPKHYVRKMHEYNSYKMLRVGSLEFAANHQQQQGVNNEDASGFWKFDNPPLPVLQVATVGKLCL